MKYGGRVWVTEEAHADIGDDLEAAAKQEVVDRAFTDGYRSIGEPRAKWLRIYELSPTDRAQMPETVRDTDWELRVWVRTEG